MSQDRGSDPLWGGDTAGRAARSGGTPGSGPSPGSCANSSTPKGGRAGPPGPPCSPLPNTLGSQVPQCGSVKTIAAPWTPGSAPQHPPSARARGEEKKINGPKATGNQNRLDSNRKAVGSSSARPGSEPHARLVKGEPRARSPRPPDAHARLQSRLQTRRQTRFQARAPPSPSRSGKRSGGGSVLLPEPGTLAPSPPRVARSPSPPWPPAPRHPGTRA